MRYINFSVNIILIFLLFYNTSYSDTTYSQCSDNNNYLLSIYDEESGEFFNTISICNIINNNYADFNQLKYDKEFKDYVLFVIKNINEKIIFFENKNKLKIDQVKIDIIYRPHYNSKKTKIDFFNKLINDQKNEDEKQTVRRYFYEEILLRESLEKKLRDIDNTFLNAKQNKKITNNRIIIESPWVKIIFDKNDKPSLFLVFVYSLPQILLDQAMLDEMNWEKANLSAEPIWFKDSDYNVLLYDEYRREMGTVYSYDEIGYNEMRRVERKFNQIPIYFLWLCRESQPFFEHRSPHYLSRFMCELQQDVAGLYKEITRLMLDHAFDSKSSYLKYETIFDLSDYIDLNLYDIKSVHPFVDKNN